METVKIYECEDANIGYVGSSEEYAITDSEGRICDTTTSIARANKIIKLFSDHDKRSKITRQYVIKKIIGCIHCGGGGNFEFVANDKHYLKKCGKCDDIEQAITKYIKG